MSVLKAKHQRLVLFLAGLVAMLLATILLIWAASNKASFFRVPTEIVADPPSPDKAIRLGGMVERGSLIRESDGITIHFVVTDGKARVKVRFKGIVPDLFVEGSGVVADGKLGADGTFVADNLLAKHDENYVPREMKDMTDAQAKMVVEQTR